MTSIENVGAVVLAAGKGTRLNSTETPKVMLPVGGKPLVSYTIEILEQIGFMPEQICLVVGFKKESVMNYFGDRTRYAEQAQQLGTAHAANVGIKQFSSKFSTVLVLGGDDSAFYAAATLEAFISRHLAGQATVSLLTTETTDPALLGRVIRDAGGRVEKVLEKEELNDEQKKIVEVSTGTYCFNRVWFEQAFPLLPTIGKLEEYGLPKTIELARNQDKTVQAIKLEDTREWFGVNTPEELAEADRRKQSF